MTTTAERLALEPPPPQTRKTTKLLVAVHGIGDQVAYETIQSVALRVAAHLDQPLAMPLGRFYSRLPQAPGAAADAAHATELLPGGPILLRAPDDPHALADIGLAEAYWAEIPRRVVTQKFVLEETKKWARTIAGRLAYQGGGTPRARRAGDRLVVVLDELVETIQLMERLSFLAGKAGVFRFDLGKLLADFVGDVQIVADFEIFRDEILGCVDRAVQGAVKLAGHDRAAEVYLVAHSEGSVLAFIALLEALRDPATYPWITNVAGLMTIGSPIEIHHLLWPRLWRDVADLRPESDELCRRVESERGVKSGFVIPWHNYVDAGDPIAYELDETTKWLVDTCYAKHLRPRSHDFSRYYMPGKAHVDYWTDDEVFGHFLNDVVGLREAARAARAGKEPPPRGDCFNKPADAPECTAVRTRIGARLVAWFMPWALVGALLFAGVYALETGLGAAIGVSFDPPRAARDVVAFGLLLGGITAAARLPRINECLKWWAGGFGILAACFAGFAFALPPATRDALEAGLGGWGAPLVIVGAMAAVVALVAGLASRAFPHGGHRTLPMLGFVAAAVVVWRLLAARDTTDMAWWPLAIGAAFFFYLWWLGALLFDLSFVWQRYVRNSVLRSHLAGAVGRPATQPGTSAVAAPASASA